MTCILNPPTYSQNSTSPQFNGIFMNLIKNYIIFYQQKQITIIDSASLSLISMYIRDDFIPLTCKYSPQKQNLFCYLQGNCRFLVYFSLTQSLTTLTQIDLRQRDYGVCYSTNLQINLVALDQMNGYAAVYNSTNYFLMYNIDQDQFLTTYFGLESDVTKVTSLIIDEQSRIAFIPNQSSKILMFLYNETLITNNASLNFKNMDGSSSSQPKYLVYDSDKQRALFFTDDTSQILNIEESYFEFGHHLIQMQNAQFDTKKGLVIFEGLSQMIILDYLFITYSSNLIFYQSNFQPNYLKIDDNNYLYSYGYNCEIKLYSFKRLTSSIILNNGIKCILKTLQFIDDNKNQNIKYILVISDNSVISLKLFEQLLSIQQTLQIQYQTVKSIDNKSLFLDQNLNIIQLSLDQTHQIKAEVLINMNYGLSQWFMLSQDDFIYIEQSQNKQLKIFSCLIKTTRTLNIDITSFQKWIQVDKIDKSTIVILFQTLLMIIDVNGNDNQGLIKYQYVLDSDEYKTFGIDTQLNRIYLQGRLAGIILFSLTLENKQTPIHSFGSSIQNDGLYLFILHAQQVSIYFNKDLKFYNILRQFNSQLLLKDIHYLTDSLFLVEFNKKISIYLIEPYVRNPYVKQIRELYFNDMTHYTVYKYSALKKKQIDSNNYVYLISVEGLQIQGLFYLEWLVDLNQILSTTQSQSSITFITGYATTTQTCSQNFLIDNKNNFRLTKQIQQYSNVLTKYKSLLNQITIHFEYGQQILQIPIFPESYLKQDFFTVVFEGKNIVNQSQIFNNKLPISINGSKVFRLIFKNINVDFKSIERSKLTIGNLNSSVCKLKQVIFDNIKITNIDQTLIVFQHLSMFYINNLIIENLNISFSSGNDSDKFFINLFNITNVQINNLIIKNSKIQLNDDSFSFMNITGSNKIVFKNIYIENSQLSAKQYSHFFSVWESDQLIIQNVQVTNTNFTSLVLFQVKTLSKQFIVSDITFIKSTYQYSKEKLITQNIFLSIQKGQYKNSQIFNVYVSQIQINADYTSTAFIEVIDSRDFSIDTVQVYNVKTSSTNTKLINMQYNVATQIKNITFINNKQLKILSSTLEFKSLQSSDLSISDYILRIERFNCNNNVFSSPIMNIIGIHIQLNLLNFNNIGQLKSDQNYNLIEATSMISLDLNSIDITSMKNNLNSFFKFTDCNEITISKNSFTNIQCNSSGSILSIIKATDVNIFKNSMKQNEAKYNGGSMYFEQVKQIILMENIFEENTSQFGSGGVISCLQSNFKNIQNNMFHLNFAQFGSGGVFYIDKCDISKMENNQFSENKAQIGGVLRYLNLRPFILTKEKESLKILKRYNIFSENFADLYGQNFGSYIQYLDIKNSDEDDDQVSITKISDVQSGQTPPNPILLRYIDEEYKEVSFLNVNNSSYSFISEDIRKEFKQYTLQILSDDIKFQGNLMQSYDQQNFGFLFNVTFYYEPEKSAKINIQSYQQLPHFTSSSQNVRYDIFKKEIQVSFRKCKLGEVYQKFEQGTICFTCQKGNYCLVDPFTKKDIQCQPCPRGSVDCFGSEIQLSNGYWRQNEYTDMIIECYNKPENCIPEDKENINGCLKGHTGPLCENCDLSGEIWKEQYVRQNSFDCVSCINAIDFVNIFVIIVAGFAITIYMLIQIKKQMTLCENIIVSRYLKRMDVLLLGCTAIKTRTISFIKQITSYLQFMMLVNTLNIQLPSFTQIFNLAGGNPSQYFIYKLDCLYSYFDNKTLPIYVYRVIWGIMQPIILYVMIQIFLAISFRNSPISNNIFSQIQFASFIFVYIFYQSSVADIISSTMSCRNIGNHRYIQADLLFDCWDKNHLYYLYFLLLPILLIWNFIIPLYLFIRLRFHRNSFNTIRIIYKYGYLYQEYTQKAYYWEIIKIIFRTSIILVVKITDSNIYLKGLIIIALLQIYIFLSLRIKPYSQLKLNAINLQSVSSVVITITLVLLINFFNNKFVTYFGALVIMITNLLFIVQATKSVLNITIPNQKSRRSWIQEVLYNLKMYKPTLFDWVIIQPEQGLRVFINLKKVKSNIMKIIELQNTNLRVKTQNFKRKLNGDFSMIQQQMSFSLQNKSQKYSRTPLLRSQFKRRNQNNTFNTEEYQGNKILNTDQSDLFKL